MSGFPLSIGTGLALEAIFQAETESLNESPPTPLPDPSIYTSYLFNVETLIRNLISTLQYKDLVTVAPKHFITAVQEEVDYLDHFFRSNNTTPIFFVNTYSYYTNTYKDSIRKPTTDKQLLIDHISKTVVRGLSKGSTEILHFDKNIRVTKDSKSLLLSHIPADLLSFGNFSTLDLLESHTGAIKTRRHWNSKYFPVPGQDMSFLPFVEYLLVTFGDKHMFKPKNLKERMKVYEHMQKLGVNPLSSEFSMMLQLGKNK